MDSFHEKEYVLTDMHTDAFGRAKPSALLSFVQDVASEHAATLSGSWEALQAQNLFWVVNRHKMELSRLPVLGETLRLRTWPMPTSRVAYPRAVEGFDEKGECIFRMVSLWVLMDTEKRSLVLPAKGGLPIDGHLRGTEIGEPQSLLPCQFENTTSRRVVYSELDRNGHMNNTRYLEWVYDLLPPTFHKNHICRRFHLCYLAETLFGETLQLQWKLDADCTLSLDAWRETSTGRKRVFGARVEFAERIL